MERFVVERLCVMMINELATSRDDGSVERTHCDLLDALMLLCPFTEVVRYGVFVLPVRGPSRFLGGESAVLDNCRTTVERIAGVTPRLGVADGLFSALAAARRDTVVPPGESTAFRRSLPIDDLLDPSTSTTAHRLGLHHVGLFADLDVARVTERFSRSVVDRHRVARGERDVWDEERDAVLVERMVRSRGGETVAAGQQSFFGQRSEADRRATAVGFRAADRIGVERVLTATLVGGRTPSERVRWRPLGSPTKSSSASAPWPGHLPPPSPAATLTHPVRIGVFDDTHHPLTVTGRGLLSATPATVRFGHGVVDYEVAWSAGPWPHDESWWSLRRRRAHLHVVLRDERALWVYAERGAWFLAGVFD